MPSGTNLSEMLIIQDNAFENVMCEMETIWRFQRVKPLSQFESLAFFIEERYNRLPLWRLDDTWVETTKETVF